MNGTYDEVVFTREAVRLISGADPAKGFYMYLACASPHLLRLCYRAFAIKRFWTPFSRPFRDRFGPFFGVLVPVS